MRVKTEIEKSSPHGKQLIRFHFDLDSDDVLSSKSLNAGGADISLAARSATFHFPCEFKTPHPDLLAVAALKIISPYVGSRFIIDQEVSEKAADGIRRTYSKIKEISSSNLVSPRATPLEKPGISFSGGADSVAVAGLMPDTTPLIMAARVFHPDIGEFERWTKADGPIGTMGAMPNDSRKFLVHTDFPYLSTNGSYCIYPDNYAFTIPAILLADHISISHIVTGDILGGLTGNETIFNPILMPNKARRIYRSIGLDLECPCNGVSELVTSRIVEDMDMTLSSSTCEYGGFRSPCMWCIKCLRKRMYLWALTGKELTDEELNKFNNADPIKNFAANRGRGGLSMMPSFKAAFRKIGRHFSGAIGEIQNRALSCDLPTGWVGKYYPDTYKGDRPDFVAEALSKLKRYADPMSEQDILDLSRMDYRKNYDQII